MCFEIEQISDSTCTLGNRPTTNLLTSQLQIWLTFFLWCTLIIFVWILFTNDKVIQKLQFSEALIKPFSSKNCFYKVPNILANKSRNSKQFWSDFFFNSTPMRHWSMHFGDSFTVSHLRYEKSNFLYLNLTYKSHLWLIDAIKIQTRDLQNLTNLS